MMRDPVPSMNLRWISNSRTVFTREDNGPQHVTFWLQHHLYSIILLHSFKTDVIVQYLCYFLFLFFTGPDVSAIQMTH